jgi:hypothetical protein
MAFSILGDAHGYQYLSGGTVDCRRQQIIAALNGTTALRLSRFL